MALNPIDSNSDLDILKAVCDISEVKNLRAYIDGTVPKSAGILVGATVASTIAFGPVGLLVGLGCGSLGASIYMNEKSKLRGPDVILNELSDQEKRILSLMIREVISDYNITTFDSFIGNINVNQSFRKKLIESILTFGKKYGYNFRFH